MNRFCIQHVTCSSNRRIQVLVTIIEQMQTTASFTTRKYSNFLSDGYAKRSIAYYPILVSSSQAFEASISYLESLSIEFFILSLILIYTSGRPNNSLYLGYTHPKLGKQGSGYTSLTTSRNSFIFVQFGVFLLR